MSDWLDKAKEVAAKAAEEAKKLAEAAKNADYGAMYDKTKTMAMHAADEAKKAADNIMKKEQPPTQGDINTQNINPTQTQPTQSQEQPSVQSTPPVQPTAAQVASRESTSAGQQSDAHKSQILGKISQVERLLQEIKELLK